MRKRVSLLLAGMVLLGAPKYSASAHPGSGIVVDQQGRVFFIYSKHAICEVDSQGTLRYIRPIAVGHWMCLDPAGSFSHAQPKYFERVSADGVKPALIYADGGSPITVMPDGNIYYACSDTQLTPGGLRLARNSPGGEVTAFASRLPDLNDKQGIKGLAAGPDECLYVACPSAVFKVKKDGTFSTLADPIHLEGCDVDYPDNNTNNFLPSLRGLAVDEQGNVFAAGTACHCVIKISPGGKIEPILKAERPWSPTGVALHDGAVYVLEYTHATEESAKVWLPRVRKIARDGAVTTLVTITSEVNLPAKR